MSETKARVPAVPGWFTMDDGEPRLLGTRCTSCGTYFFPKQSFFCKNPSCQGTEFEEVPLGRTGTLWSYTETHYAPPAPYVSPEPFEPFSIGAVELSGEKMVILGQMTKGTRAADLRLGMEVELVLETLFEDDANEYVVWKWKPVAA
jgi:uncharacterized OB-fold protein